MKLIKIWESDLNKSFELFKNMPSNETGFENIAYGMNFDQFKNLALQCKDHSVGLNLREGYVPDTVFILEDEGVYKGVFNLRHCLNDFLRNGPGHIGFYIGNNYRNKGLATKGLALAVKEAEGMGIKKILMSLNKDNKGSLKAQMNNGAKVVREDETKYYTEINL